MSYPSEEFQFGEAPREEKSFNELLASFDKTDAEVLMSYSRYLDKPSPQRMDEISLSTSELFGSFSDVMQRIAHDDSGVIDRDAAPAVLATLLHDMERDHSTLMADYVSNVVVPTGADRKEAIGEVTDELEESLDSMGVFADTALSYFRQTLDTDMEIIERYVVMRAGSPVEVLKQRAAQTSLELAKIGAGVLAGLFIYDKLKKS